MYKVAPPNFIFSLLLPRSTRGLQSTHLKDTAGFPLIVTEEPTDKDTGHVYGTCHGEMREDERSKARRGLASHNNFQCEAG